MRKFWTKHNIEIHLFTKSTQFSELFCALCSFDVYHLQNINLPKKLVNCQICRNPAGMHIVKRAHSTVDCGLLVFIIYKIYIQLLRKTCKLPDFSKSQQPSRYAYCEKSTTHSCHPVVKWIPLGNWAELELTLSERQNSKSKSTPEFESPWGYLFLHSNLKYVYSIVNATS